MPPKRNVKPLRDIPGRFYYFIVYIINIIQKYYVNVDFKMLQKLHIVPLMFDKRVNDWLKNRYYGDR